MIWYTLSPPLKDLSAKKIYSKMIRITPWKYADSLTEWPFEQDDEDKDDYKKTQRHWGQFSDSLLF